MEVIFLGTSSGTPTRTRNVSAIAVRRKQAKSWCMVDCGEGTQHQILKSELSLMHLEAILITHVHGDHCFGLPGLLSSATMLGRKKKLIIVAPAAVKEFVTSAQKVSEARMSYDLDFIDVEKYAQENISQAFNIEIIELSHRVPSYAYALTEKVITRKLDTKKLITHDVSKVHWSKLQKKENVTLENGSSIDCQDYLLPPRQARKIIISGDNDRPGLLAASATATEIKAQLVIHEATYTQVIADKVGPGPQHSSAKQVAEFAEQVGLKNLILTHFSPRYKDGVGIGSIEEIETEARKYFSGNLLLAEDMAIFALELDGDVKRVGK